MVHNTIFSQHAAVAAGLLTVAATTLGTYYYMCSRLKKSKFPTEWRTVGEVSKLCIYPFKSGKRLEVDQAECTKQGLMEEEKFDKSFRLRDRSFVMYHEESHKYINARHHPKMILVEIRAEHMNHVLFNAPDMDTLLLRIPDKTRNKEVVVKHYRNEEIYSIDCGNEAATWISQYLLEEDSGLRIAFHDGSYTRNQINSFYKGKIDYYKRGLRNESSASGLNSDLTAMHIINQASVADINKRMGHSDVTADYFRSNLVVDGPNLKPYEEDDWMWIKVGDVVMKNVVECMRCSITTTNPETGVRREDREPLTTMRTISKGPEKAPVMGILLEVFQSGNISVGEMVYVGKG